MSTEYRYTPSEIVRNYETYKARCCPKEASGSPLPANPSIRRSARMVVAATQMTAAGLEPSDMEGFVQRAKDCVAAAAQDGCNVILLQELFAGPYFCQSQEAELMALADPWKDHVLVKEFQTIAKQYGVILPISFYERHHNALYNSICVIDHRGTVLDTLYRKSHIPDGTGYQEKFYFSPGDTGFRVFSTELGTLGIAICWDQWFPEAARAMALQGADVLLYPTAIGSEPQDSTLNSADHWQRVMQGHAAANMVPVVASNRFGTEVLCRADGTEQQRIVFYGRSFVTDNTGALMDECKPNSDDNTPFQFVKTVIDVEQNRKERAAWGLFRDRRPELYSVLLTKDGTHPAV